MKWNERGQVLLAVILIAVVALTIGLSLVSRSISSVRVATQSEESQRAFRAAETGVELALEAIQTDPTSTSLSDDLSNNARYEASITPIGNEVDILLNGGNVLEQDVGSDVWLSQYPDYSGQISGNFQVFFGSETQSQCTGNGPNIRPAIEILVLSGQKSNPTLTKHIVDPCDRITGSAGSAGGGEVDGVNFLYSYIFPATDGLIARVIPIYNSTVVGMRARSASGAFPPQGSVIESTGTSGESVRKIQVFQSHPQIPIELFQYAILSQ